MAVVSDLKPEATAKIEGARVVGQAADLADQDVDLVIEAANAEVVRVMAPRVLKKHDFLIFTVTPLGIGFDRTISRVVADPQTDQMAREIVVKGAGLKWCINISSRAMGAVTGSYTPESAAMTVRRILSSGQGITLV